MSDSAIRLIRSFSLSILFLTGLMGCSTVEEGMAPARLQAFDATYGFNHEWRNFVGVGQDARYSRLQPVVVDEQIYTVDVKGHLIQVDPKTGDKNWTLDLESAIGGGVGFGGGLLFLGTLAGELIAIDPVTVTEKWRVQTSSEIVSAPQANDNVVIVSTIDGRVFAYDINDGSKRWNYDHPTPILSLRSMSNPLVKGENVFIGFDNGQLLNFKSNNGQLVWTARVGQPKGKTELERLVDIDANPFELGPYIYAAGYNSRLIAVTRGSGTVMWAQELSTSQNMASDDNTIVVIDANSHLKAVDALTGTVLWESELLHRRAITSPAVLNGVVVVVDSEGVVHGFALKTGEYVARYHSRHTSVSAQPVVFNGLIYLLDTRGELAAFSVNSIK